MSNDYLSDVFGPGGLLQSRSANYEAREGQIALSRLVDQAMREGRHAAAEAPCGTGKSRAYCVPAIHHAHHRGKRVVVATANVALQEQLVTQDLPRLAEVLPWKFSFSLLKGRNNYACHARVADSDVRGELRGMYDLQDQIDTVRAWFRTTKTGDVSELPIVPAHNVWSKFAITADECKGETCAYRGECFSERAKRVANASDIVVTNYHLLFAHLALRRDTGQDLLLPAFDFLVLDEAHAAADIARSFFGYSVSEASLGRIASSVAELGFKRLAGELRLEARGLFERFATHPDVPRGGRLRHPGLIADDALQECIGRVVAAAAHVDREDNLAANTRATARRVARLAELAGDRIREGLQQVDAEKVYWIDVDSKARAVLEARPVRVDRLLHRQLFDPCESVSLVSATLATRGSFDFLQREVGLPDGALELVAPSPFDSSRALLVIPDDAPDPRTPDFPDAASAIFDQAIALCEGRTLGLFTSYRVLNHVHQHLRDCAYRVLRQGDLPRGELLRIFREDTSSVLLGAESFWAGVDVPGPALTAVVIDKLPFPPPDNPVIAALCEGDPNAFENHLLPRVETALKQGMGRLLRTKDDYGVIVVCDRRLRETRYGKALLAHLPPLPLTRSIADIPIHLFDIEHSLGKKEAYARAS
ncbi:ATP-dependent DNA helicase [Pendulispora brunnea]|uniref:DNA 5'-3' helicase n=1 Tax=Pendulispora brunnea TaxID=2905690 RepID=A0ABZ2K776_9BACT